MISCTRVSGLSLDAEEPQTRAAGEGRMSRSTERGEAGNIYRYASIMVYKLTQGSRRRKDVQFQRGGGGKHVAAGEEAMSRSTEGGGGKTYIVMPIYSCI